jgi:hypothetical protein
MTLKARNWMLFVGALLVLALVIGWIRSQAHSTPGPPPVSVVFTELMNDPVARMAPARVAVGAGATGLCAMFWVTNTSTDKYCWIRTAGVETQGPGGWQERRQIDVSWYGVMVSMWRPGYGCLVAVGWPPGIPTNECWRLKLIYGEDPSLGKSAINQKLGWVLFHPSDELGRFASSEVCLEPSGPASSP